MKLRRISTALLILLLITGCTEKSSYQKEQAYHISLIESNGVKIPILSYTDEHGDFYFRVLPDEHFLFENSEALNGYPYEWTLVTKPTFK